MFGKKVSTGLLSTIAMFVVVIAAFNLLGTAIGIVVMLFVIGWLFWRRRATLHYNTARKAFSDGDMEKARENAQKAMRLEPDQSIMQSSCGYMLMKMGRPVEAERALTLALNVAKNDEEKSQARLMMSLLLWKKGRLGDAFDMLEEVTQTYRTTATYSTLGFFHLERGDAEKALAYNKDAYDYNAKNTVIVDNYGSALLLADRPEEALEVYEILMGMEPAFPEAFYNYGRVLEALGRNEKALDMYRTASSKKFWYTSTITREDVERRLDDLEERMGIQPENEP